MEVDDEICSGSLDNQQSIQVPDTQEPMDTTFGIKVREDLIQIQCPTETTVPPNDVDREMKLEIPDIKLEETHNGHHLVVPMVPNEEIECLLLAAIELSKKGTVENIGVCQYLFKGLEILFTKILTDDTCWKSITHDSIRSNCEKLMELCVLNLQEDWFPLLDLLAVVFDPHNKFLVHNIEKESETVPHGLDIPKEELYARPSGVLLPEGWLVDFVNIFGNLRGFDYLLERIQKKCNLSLTVIHALIRPFGLCIDLLTVHTLVTYFFPIVRITIHMLNNLFDEELKDEATSDQVLRILVISKTLMTRIPHQGEIVAELNALRMKTILRILQISSFDGQICALNEIGEIIKTIKLLRTSTDEDKKDCMTAVHLIQWMKENNVLEIVLKDSLNKKKYVEKLEKILSFMIEERALTLEDLYKVWEAHDENHEEIVKNVHNLLAKLARDFHPKQLDHFFKWIKTSLKTANPAQSEQLLKLIKHLPKDGKDGGMRLKVLTFLWDFAHSDQVSTEIMNRIFKVHVEILATQKNAPRVVWLDKFVEKAKKDDRWVLPALKQIHAITSLYGDSTKGHQSGKTLVSRREVIRRLQNDHLLCEFIITNLTQYMRIIAKVIKNSPNIDLETFMPDNRYNHITQVQERLNFLLFFLKTGRYWLTSSEAAQIWKCLVEQSFSGSDREICFKWFSQVVEDQPYSDPMAHEKFFKDSILLLDPTLLTENGIKCYGKYFKTVNTRNGKLKWKWKEQIFFVEDHNLLGIDYLWKVVKNSSKEIVNQASELLRQVYTKRTLPDIF